MTDPKISVEISARLDGFERTLNQASDKANTVFQKIESSSSGLDSTFNKLGGTLAAAFSVGAVVGFVKSLSDAQQITDKLNNSLSFSAGSAAGARAEMGYLRDITRKLGLDFVSTAQAYAKFAAATKTSGMSSSDTKTIFEGISAAATKMGLSADESSGALLALSQMASKGTVQSEELRGQLAERLPGAFAIAAKSIGVTTAELGKMLENGQVIASDFLPRFGRALKEEFGGSVNSLTQEINRLNSAWDQWKMTLSNSDGGGFQWITKGLNESAAAMRALGAEAGITQKILVAIGGFQAGALGSSKFDTAQKQEQAMQSLQDVRGQRESLEGQKEKYGSLPPITQRRLDSLKTQEAAIRESIINLAVQRGKETGLKLPDLAGEYAAQITKQDERIKAYLADVTNAPKAAKVSAAVDKENKAFEASVVGLQKTDARYIGALKAHNERIAEITKPAKEPKGPADPYDALIKGINERISVQRLEDNAQRSLTEGEKLAAKVMSDIADGTLKLTEAQKIKVSASLEELISIDKLNTARKGEAEAMQYLGEIQKRYDRDNSAKRDSLANLPEAVARLNAELRAVDETAAEGNKKLAKMMGDGKLSADAFAEKMAQLNDLTATQKDQIIKLNEAQDKLNASWEVGAERALQKYQDKAANVAQRTEEYFTKAYQGVESAMSDFLFDPFDKGVSGMLQSFGAVIRRMIADAAAADLSQKLFGKLGSGASSSTGLLSQMLGSSATTGYDATSDTMFSSAGSGLLGWFGKLTGRASGGPVSAGGMYRVNENNPELLNVSGNTYLMMGSKDGTVLPNKATAGGGQAINITVHVNGNSSAPDVRRAAGQGAREALAAFNSAGRYR